MYRYCYKVTPFIFLFVSVLFPLVLFKILNTISVVLMSRIKFFIHFDNMLAIVFNDTLT